jgi:hypothetical protein
MSGLKPGPISGASAKAEKKQIPKGNDRKKGKSKGECKYGILPLRCTRGSRMTGFVEGLEMG